MVVVTNAFATQQQARRVVGQLGVPEKVLRATELNHETVDWRELAGTLDDVFLALGGGMGQAWFLRERHPELDGLTPIEALAEDDGPRRVGCAARGFVARSKRATPITFR